MAKIILNESQLKRLIDNTLSEQSIPANIPMANTMNKIGGMFNAASGMANKTNIAARNAALMKPGENASDYFLNPDGSIKVTDLPGVTVSAKRGPAPAIANAKNIPLPQVNAPVQGIQGAANSGQKYTDLPMVTVSGEKGPAPAIASAKDIPLPQVNAPVQGVQTGTSSVASGPTNPQAQAGAAKPAMSGEQMHNLLMQKGLINGFKDLDGYENRRIVYKGAPLSQEQLNTLSTYLQDKGYGKRFAQVGDKRYGQKYVWVKGGSALPSDMAV